jgi:hypothetical protein
MALEVLGWCHRGGKLHLTLVLPDGTRALIAAAWTDLRSYESAANVQRTQAASLASRTELLQGRTIVDALLRQWKAADTAPPSTPQENSDAAAELSRSTATAERPARVEHPRRGTARASRKAARASDRQNNRPSTQRARQ